MKLTKSEIRIKVAELCGWKWSLNWTGQFRYLWHKNHANGNQVFVPANGDEEFCTNYYSHTPNYPEDLNACAEMEATMPVKLETRYIKELGLLSSHGWANLTHISAIFPLVHASPLHRCLAFLRTHGIDAELAD